MKEVKETKVLVSMKINLFACRQMMGILAGTALMIGNAMAQKTDSALPVKPDANKVVSAPAAKASLSVKPDTKAGQSVQRATGWRGDGTGFYPSAKPPTTWSTNVNVVWKTPIPEWGNASPVLVGDKVLVCSEPANVICLDASTGKILWTKKYGYDEAGDGSGAPPRTHPDTGFSTPTVVSDGKFVYAASGLGTAACYDMEGNPKWVRFLEKFDGRSILGNSASPILADGKLFVHLSCLYALDSATGKTLWRREVSESFGTPLAMQTGQDTLIITGGGNVINASSGMVWPQTLWDMGTGENSEGGSPVVADGAVFMGKSGRAWVYRFSGASQPAQLLWSGGLHLQRYHSSPVVANGLVFTLSGSGKLRVLDATSGEVVVDRTSGLARIYSSLAVAGGYLYASGENGTTIVMEADRQCREVARNKLEPFRSCLAFEGNRMFVRTLRALYCIGQ